MNSDYRSRDDIIRREATIEFLLAQLAENCSFSRSCMFEGEGACAAWRVGGGVRLVSAQQSPLPIRNPFTGSCLYAVSADSEVVMASSVISDDFCGVSFAFAVSSTTEIVVLVDGLDGVWSSLASPGESGWTNRTVRLDLEDVEISQNRSLSFVARFSSDESAYVASAYAALDNITLHPCTDCATPGRSQLLLLLLLLLFVVVAVVICCCCCCCCCAVCTFTSCVPGHYYSLDHGSCVDCPPGH